MQRDPDSPFLAEAKEITSLNHGWKADTLYLVDVSYSSGNPVHKAFLHVGFLNKDGTPGSYSEIWCNTYEHSHRFSEAHYLRALKVLHNEED